MTDDATSRRSFYLLMIVIAMAIAAGRIATVTSREGTTAFLSANDRSRWCTIAALVEDGTFVIDRQMRLVDRKGRRNWQTIDAVRHRAGDGRQHYFSSKPPLLPWMIAGVYAVVGGVTGMTLTDQPIYMTRIVLMLVNLPMLLAFYLATLFCIERVGRHDWSRRFAAAAVCFGTMVLPFAISLSNHLPAAAATAVVAAIYLMASGRDSTSTRWFWVAGLASGFVAANELPALSMVGLWGLLFLRLERRSVIGYVGGVVIVAVAFFAVNWLAHQSLRPPYAHRGVGEVVGEIPPDREALDENLLPLLRSTDAIDEGETIVKISPSEEPDRLKVETSGERLFAVLMPSEGARGDRSWQVRRWDDWYEYEGSYWQTERRGVDRGEPSRVVYFLHATIGHYGIFSLTPIWCLVPLAWFRIGRLHDRDQQWLLAAIALATLVCFAFYMARPQIDRNYGGVSVCFRWMLWFAPLWMIALMPGLDWLSRIRGKQANWGQWAALLMLFVSVFSVSTSLGSPWQSPWIYRYLQFLGWLGG